MSSLVNIINEFHSETGDILSLVGVVKRKSKYEAGDVVLGHKDGKIEGEWFLKCSKEGITGETNIGIPENAKDGMIISDGEVEWTLERVTGNGETNNDPDGEYFVSKSYVDQKIAEARALLQEQFMKLLPVKITKTIEPTEWQNGTVRIEHEQITENSIIVVVKNDTVSEAKIEESEHGKGYVVLKCLSSAPTQSAKLGIVIL